MILSLKPFHIPACLTLLIIASGGASAQEHSASSATPAQTIIDMQLHAVDAKAPDSHVAGMEANAIYRHYLADIGRPLTRNDGSGSEAQSQTTAPMGTGGH